MLSACVFALYRNRNAIRLVHKGKIFTISFLLLIQCNRLTLSQGAHSFTLSHAQDHRVTFSECTAHRAVSILVYIYKTLYAVLYHINPTFLNTPYLYPRNGLI